VIGKVLVVDDEPEFCEVLVSYLVEHGYDVREAHDAETALRIAGSDPPNVVLLDIAMPGMNGLEALRRFRRDHPSLVVVMVSGIEDEALARSTLQLGALDYVTKPFDWERLEQVIQAAMGRVPPAL